MTDDQNEQSPVRRFAALWESASVPPDVFSFLAGARCASLAEFAEVVHLDQNKRSELGQLLEVEGYLAIEHDPALDDDVKLSLIACDFECRRRIGEDPQVDEYAKRFSQFGERLSEVLGDSHRKPTFVSGDTDQGSAELHQTIHFWLC